MFERIGANLEQYMNVLTARQKLVASNIANVDTPAFHTTDIVDFQTEFQNAKNGFQPRSSEVAGLAVKPDKNNVSLEREVRLLSENSIRFQLASQLAQGEIRGLKSAIQDGKS